jgi:hypothetical protein
MPRRGGNADWRDAPLSSSSSSSDDDDIHSAVKLKLKRQGQMYYTTLFCASALGGVPVSALSPAKLLAPTLAPGAEWRE